MGSVLREYTTEVIDHSTGEIVESKREQVLSIASEPPFVKLYLEDLRVLHKLPPATSSLMIELVKRVDYEGIVALNATIKKIMATRLEVSLAGIDNQISKLHDRDILRRIGRGTYMLNPNLFAKGQWKDIRKLRDKFLELKITYTPEGKRIVTSTLIDGNGNA